MGFAERIEQAVKDAEALAATDTAKEYRRVLDEMTTALAKLGIGAEIKVGHDPRKLSLYVYPQFRPQRGTVIMTFFIAKDDHIEVTGGFRLPSAIALEEHLVRFVASESFVALKNELADQARWPVEARLRVSRDVVFSSGDVLVRVDADTQSAIAQTVEGGDVSLSVERIEFPGNPRFPNEPAYAVLDSAGIEVKIVSAVAQGARLDLKGTRV